MVDYLNFGIVHVCTCIYVAYIFVATFPEGRVSLYTLPITQSPVLVGRHVCRARCCNITTGGTVVVMLLHEVLVRLYRMGLSQFS